VVPIVHSVASVPSGADTEITVVDWLDPRQDEIWRLLLVVQGRMLARLDEELRLGHGLSLSDYDVLVALSESVGGLRMTELAERVMLSPSGLTRRVDRLVARSLVDRRACPSDGRGSLAVLTAGGWQSLRRAAPTHVAGVRRYLVYPLSSEGIEQLALGLRAVSAALDAGDGSGPARPGGAQAETGRGPTPSAQPGSEPVATG
jgi:DNA-binding MarR family transcriptional regulator